MTKILLLALSVIPFCASFAAITRNTWNCSVKSGEWTTLTNWTTKTFYPMEALTAADFNAVKGGETAVECILPDAVGKMERLHILHQAPSVFTFDGANRTFGMGALEEGVDTQRGLNQDGGSFYPFQVASVSASSTQALMLGNYSAGAYKPVLTWENALFRTYSESDRSVQVEFLRGAFDFDPANVAGWNLRFSSAPNSYCGMLISNSTVKASVFSAYGQATNNAIAIAEGGVLRLSRTSHFFNGGDYSYVGTNTLSVCDGGRIVVDNGGEMLNNYYVYFGTEKNAASRRNEIEFSGSGTLLDMRQSSSSAIQGNTRFTITDGASAVLPGRFFLGFAAPGQINDYKTELHVSGDDTRIFLMTNTTVLTTQQGNGQMYVGHVPYASNSVVMAGGKILPLYPAASGTSGVSIFVGDGAAGNGIFEMRGGEIDLIVTNCDNQASACAIHLGPGNALFDMSGGKVVCGDFFVGRSQNNDPEKTQNHIQRLRMTGGELTCNRLYLGSSEGSAPVASYQYQQSHVDLDGGVLVTKQANVFSSALKGEGYYAKGYLSANGGTIRSISGGTCLVSGFWTAELGPKGLTIDAVKFKTISVTQSFSNKDGEEGLLVFKGRGEGSSQITYDPDRYCTVTRTVVDACTLNSSVQQLELKTELVLTNGAKYSTVGNLKNLTLKALKVPNGTILVDPGDVISITSADVDFEGLTVKFNSDPEYEQPYGIFAFEGDVSKNETVLKALRRLSVFGVSSEHHWARTLVYDEASGKTVLNVTVKENGLLPYADSTVWNGGEWNSEGWEQGVPAEEIVASFSNPGAVEAVQVPAGAKVGAMEFSSGHSYTFAGDMLHFLGDKERSFINVASGDQVFENLLAILNPLQISVSPGASLTFAGGIDGAGIAKTGKGALILSGENDFTSDVEIGSGMNVIANGNALNVKGGKVYLTDDTACFAGSAGDPEMVISAPVVVKSQTSTTNAVVLKADSDVRFKDLSVESGAIIKRGKGKLTIEAQSSRETVLQAGLGVGKSANLRVNSTEAVEFAEDGTAPLVSKAQYTAFNVAEGELVVKGEPGVSKRVNMASASLVGMFVSGDSANFEQSALTIDGADVNANGKGGHGVLGYCLGKTGGAVKSPRITVLNGGKIDYPTLYVGESSNNIGVYPLIALTNGTLTALNGLRFHVAGQATNKHASVVRAKDSTLATRATGGNQHGIFLNGSTMFDLENTFFGGQNEIAKLNLYTKYLFGEVYLHGGSVLAARPYLSDVAVPSGTGEMYKFTLAFNDAEWRLGDGDFTITTNIVKNSYAFYTGLHNVEMRGVGVVLKPALGQTIAVDMPFIGEGGLVSAGEGTVKLVRGAYSFKGLLDVRSGTVDLRESDLVNSASLCGPGRVMGGKFGTLKICLGGGDTLEGKAPSFDGLKANRVTVDLGAQA